MTNRPTQRDTAEKLGIDRTTVSKVLSDPTYTTTGETRQRVLDMAKKIGYKVKPKGDVEARMREHNRSLINENRKLKEKVRKLEKKVWRMENGL